MAKLMERYENEGGSSARNLVLMFLAAVAVCAIFFSLGFVVGYNHSPSKVNPVTENVTNSGNIPPAVNAPADASTQPANQGIEAENVGSNAGSAPPPERPQPLGRAPAETAKPTVQRTAESVAPQRAARSRPAPERTSRAAHTGSTSGGSHFAVQVMASKSRTDAENLVKLLKARGYPAFILTLQQSQANDNLYRVQVGPYPSRVGADSVRDKLEGEGFRPFVVH
jgi:cell division septation protein DedD